MGGDQRSHASRGTAKLVLSLYEVIPDITLQELRAALAEKGPVLRFRLSFAYPVRPVRPYSHNTSGIVDLTVPSVLYPSSVFFFSEKGGPAGPVGDPSGSCVPFRGLNPLGGPA